MFQRQTAPTNRLGTHSCANRTAAEQEASGSRLPTLHTSRVVRTTHPSTRDDTVGPHPVAGPSNPTATRSAPPPPPHIPDNDEPAAPEVIEYLWELLRRTNDDVDGLIRDNDAVTENLGRVQRELVRLGEHLRIKVGESRTMEAFLGRWVREEEGNEAGAAEETRRADRDEDGGFEGEEAEEAEEAANHEQHRRRADKRKGKQRADGTSREEEEERENPVHKTWTGLNPSYDRISYAKKTLEEKEKMKNTREVKEEEEEEPDLEYEADDDEESGNSERSGYRCVHAGTKRGRHEDEDDEAPTPKRARVREPSPPPPQPPAPMAPLINLPHPSTFFRDPLVDLHLGTGIPRYGRPPGPSQPNPSLLDEAVVKYEDLDTLYM